MSRATRSTSGSGATRASASRSRALPIAAMFATQFAASGVDQDARMASQPRQEVSPAVPILRSLTAHESQVRLVDQSRGRQGLAGRFRGHPGCR